MCSIIWQFWHGDHRQALADARPFDRVVIDKDQAIDTDVEAGRDGLKVFRFIIPISQEGGDIGATKEHFGMLVKYRFGGLCVVLGADGQNNPAILELLGIALQGQMCFASCAPLSDNDALQPVVTDHAAPQGVVKIEDKAFLRQPALSGQDPSDKIAV